MMNSNLSRFDLFKLLGNYCSNTHITRFVNRDEFKDDFKSLYFDNGGSWCRRSVISKLNYKFATMSSSGKTINIFWNCDKEEEELIRGDFMKNCKIIKGTTKVYYFKIFGLKDKIEDNNTGNTRNIRKDIKEYYKDKPCVVCGSNSELVCDHKNDLYNNLRVLNLKTQLITDFQSLCIHCNLQKRQISKKTKELNKRYSAKNIPQLSIYNIEFISGDENYDINDPNAMVGTYWYDPIEFVKQCIKLKE